MQCPAREWKGLADEQNDCGSVEIAVEFVQEQTLHRSLSEGDLPEACQSLTSLGAEQMASASIRPAPTVAPSVLGHRPSVGTWLLGRRAVAARSGSENDNSVSLRSASANAREPRVERSWHARPSVGTWLSAYPRRAASLDVARSPSPKRSPTAQSRQGIRSLSKESKCELIWPATPTSTPPDSPRFKTGQVVWVPVPVHLLGEVQRVLYMGTASQAPMPATSGI